MKKIISNFYGLHLIELLITLAIIAILTAVSLPLYSQYIVQARRLEATSELSKLAVALEQYQIEHDTYQGATLATLKFPTEIAKNNYRLVIETATDGNYLLAAVPIYNQAAKDNVCGTLTLNSNGEKSVRGRGTVEACW